MRMYFDTSSINQIMKDADREILISKILANHEPFVSVMNIAEVGANGKQEERDHILGIAKSLSRGYYPFARPQDILYRSLSTYLAEEPTFNLSLSEQDMGLWEILNQHALIDDAVQEQCLKWTKQQKDWFRSMHLNGRPNLQKVLKNLDSRDKTMLQRSSASFLRHLMNNDEFMIDTITGIVTEGYKRPIKGQEIELLSKLEPWRFYLSAMAVGIYNLSIRESKFGHLKNAGSVDLEQAVYLAGVDVFVTDDKSQRKALRIIERFGHDRTAILNYNQLKKLLGISVDK